MTKKDITEREKRVLGFIARIANEGKLATNEVILKEFPSMTEDQVKLMFRKFEKLGFLQKTKDNTIDQEEMTKPEVMFLAESLGEVYNSAKVLPKQVGYIALLDLIKQAESDDDYKFINETIKSICIILNGRKEHDFDDGEIESFEKDIEDFFIKLPLLHNVLIGDFEINDKFEFSLNEQGKRRAINLLKKLDKEKK